MSEKKDLQEQLEAIQEQLKSLSKELKQEQKRSRVMFYSAIMLGILCGILGNYYVSYWFMLSEQSDKVALTGLIASGLGIVVLLAMLLKELRKNLR